LKASSVELKSQVSDRANGSTPAASPLLPAGVTLPSSRELKTVSPDLGVPAEKTQGIDDGGINRPDEYPTRRTRDATVGCPGDRGQCPRVSWRDLARRAERQLPVQLTIAPSSRELV
jgi:hypothetical protein